VDSIFSIPLVHECSSVPGSRIHPPAPPINSQASGCQPFPPENMRSLTVWARTAASTLNNLGSLLESTGKLAEAERLERRALPIFARKVGPASMELATTCSNLADVLWAKGDRPRAESLYTRAVSIDEFVCRTRKSGSRRRPGQPWRAIKVERQVHRSPPPAPPGLSYL
jgi:hypothetical protein